MGFAALSFGTLAFLGLVSTFVTARVYGVHVIGEFALVMAPVGAMWLLSTLQEQPALVRELTRLEPRAPRVTGLFCAVFAFSMGLTIVIGLAAIAVSALLFNGPIDQPGLVAPAIASIGGFIFLTNPSWNLDAIFSAFLAGRQLFWIRLHEAVAFILIALGLGLVWKDVWSLVIATAGAVASALIHRLIAVRPLMSARVSRAELRDGFRKLPEMLRFGVKVMPGTIFSGLSVEVQTWLLGALTSVALVGAYNRALILGRRLLDLNGRIVEILFPTLVSRHESGDDYGFDRAVVDTLRYLALALLAIGAPVAGASVGVMSLFGPGFDQASTALAVLMFLPLLAIAGVIQSHALYAVDRPTVTSVVAAARLVVSVVASLLLIPPFGVDGAAIALVGAALVDVALKFGVLRRHLAAPITRRGRRRDWAVTAIAWGAAFGVSRAIDGAIESHVDVLVALPAGALTFVAVFTTLGGASARDWARVREAVEAVKARRAAQLEQPI